MGTKDIGHVHENPCLQCHPQKYIRMVQHLIERCLILHMTRDACVEALASRANIKPKITLIVWKELMKENKAFFHNYFQDISPRPLCYPRTRSPYGSLQRMTAFNRRKQAWK